MKEIRELERSILIESQYDMKKYEILDCSDKEKRMVIFCYDLIFVKYKLNAINKLNSTKFNRLNQKII